MSITISNKAQTPPVSPVALRTTAQRPAEKVETEPTDKVTLGTKAEPPATYADPRSKALTTPAALEAMLEESNRKAQEVINLIKPLVEQQGLNLAKVVSGEQKLNADPATIEKAKAAIADNGEFGVRQVAERILNFAKGAIGDDPSKLATIRAAVEDGFSQAAEMLGGTLPEISQKTYAAIMETFDQWGSDGIPTGSTFSLASKGDNAAAKV
jgi:hypothetical protein